VNIADLTRHIREKAIPIEDFNYPSEEIVSSISKHKAVLIGELHGTNEIPQAVSGLIRALSKLGKPVILAAEIWHTEQDAVDAYMQTGDLDILRRCSFFNHALQYGVGSSAMVDLIKNVRELPNIEVLCFDPYSNEHEGVSEDAKLSKSQDRDYQMAEILAAEMQESPDTILVVLTGGLHAATEKVSFSGVDYAPMGYWLSRIENSPLKQEEILSVLVKCESGQFWGGCSENGQPITYGVHEIGTFIDDYVKATHWTGYFLIDMPFEEGYNSLLFIRKLSPSNPFHRVVIR
jgi:hypothetical protein